MDNSAHILTQAADPLTMMRMYRAQFANDIDTHVLRKIMHQDIKKCAHSYMMINIAVKWCLLQELREFEKQGAKLARSRYLRLACINPVPDQKTRRKCLNFLIKLGAPIRTVSRYILRQAVRHRWDTIFDLAVQYGADPCVNALIYFHEICIRVDAPGTIAIFNKIMEYAYYFDEHTKSIIINVIMYYGSREMVDSIIAASAFTICDFKNAFESGISDPVLKAHHE
jgi:hypothetical protein